MRKYFDQLLETIGLTEEEAIKKATQVIRTEEQLNQCLSKLLKKKTVKVINLELGYDFNRKNIKINQLLISSESESRIRDFQTINILEEVKIRHRSQIKAVKNFTFDFCTLSLDKSAKSNKNVPKCIFSGQLIIVHNLETGWLYLFSDLNYDNGKVLSLDNGQYRPLSDIENLDKNKFSVYYYKFDPSSASAKRTDSGTFEEITEDKRFERYDDASAGALTISYNNAIKKNSSIVTEADRLELKKSLLKQIGYFGNLLTAGTNFGPVRGFHVLHGKWYNNIKEGFLSQEYADLILQETMAEKSNNTEEVIKIQKKMKEVENTILKKQSTADGVIEINGLELCVNFWFQFRILIVSPELLFGKTGQARPAPLKGLARVHSPEVYNQFIAGSIELCDKFNKENPGKMEVKQYGDCNHSLFIADMNAIKLEFDYNRSFDFYVLNFTKESTSKTSKQTLLNALFASLSLSQDDLNNTVNLLSNIQKARIDESLAYAIDKDKKPDSITPDEIINALDNNYIAGPMLKTGPQFLSLSKAFYDKAVGQTINSLVESIDKLSEEAIIKNRKLLPDPTFVLTGGRVSGILDLGYCFINDRYIDKTVMFKYPSEGLTEDMLMRNSKLAVIKSKTSGLLASGTITDTMHIALNDYFTAARSTNSILPASIFLMLAISGLDYDGDTGAFMDKIRAKFANTLSKEFTNYLVDLIEKRNKNNGQEGVWINLG